MNFKKVATQKLNHDLCLVTEESKVKRPPYKIELCINELLTRSSLGMIELEALQAYGETCLHTTISALANRHGLLIHRQSEPHKHRRGGTTHFTRYSLIDDKSVIRAQNLLEHYSKLRCGSKEAA